MAAGQIRVNIFGSEYTLISDSDENYVKEIARYIDEKMREIDKNHSIKSTAKVAILAALNITEELFQERLYRQKLLARLEEEAQRLNSELAEVLEE